MINPNPVSDGQKYSHSFLTKEALLGQDIDFRLMRERPGMPHADFYETLTIPST